jgi:hypothetical protein
MKSTLKRLYDMVIARIAPPSPPLVGADGLIHINPKDSHTTYHQLSLVRGLPVPYGVVELPHSVLIPMATYSPWLADKDFNDAYAQAHTHTLVDLYRMYELWDLARKLARLGRELMDELKDGVFIHNINGHLIVVKVPQIGADRTSSSSLID